MCTRKIKQQISKYCLHKNQLFNEKILRSIDFQWLILDIYKSTYEVEGTALKNHLTIYPKLRSQLFCKLLD